MSNIGFSTLVAFTILGGICPCQVGIPMGFSWIGFSGRIDRKPWVLPWIDRKNMQFFFGTCHLKHTKKTLLGRGFFALTSPKTIIRFHKLLHKPSQTGSKPLEVVLGQNRIRTGNRILSFVHLQIAGRCFMMIQVSHLRCWSPNQTKKPPTSSRRLSRSALGRTLIRSACGVVLWVNHGK